jgi:hypothetical protein
MTSGPTLSTWSHSCYSHLRFANILFVAYPLLTRVSYHDAFVLQPLVCFHRPTAFDTPSDQDLHPRLKLRLLVEKHH